MSAEEPPARRRSNKHILERFLRRLDLGKTCLKCRASRFVWIQTCSCDFQMSKKLQIMDSIWIAGAKKEMWHQKSPRHHVCSPQQTSLCFHSPNPSEARESRHHCHPLWRYPEIKKNQAATETVLAIPRPPYHEVGVRAALAWRSLLTPIMFDPDPFGAKILSCFAQKKLDLPNKEEKYNRNPIDAYIRVSEATIRGRTKTLQGCVVSWVCLTMASPQALPLKFPNELSRRNFGKLKVYAKPRSK